MVLNAYTRYPVLTFFIIDQPLDIVVDGWWEDAHRKFGLEDLEPNFRQILESKECNREFLNYLLYDSNRPDYCRRLVDFDLNWIYKVRPSEEEELTIPTLFWTPNNSPRFTAVMVNSLDGFPTLFGPSIDHRDWQYFWAFVDDALPESSVCAFQFTSQREAIYREVWAGLDNDDETKPKWRFDKGGPVQFFEKPNNYRATRIQDRLTRSSIADYCKRLGCDITSDDFWTSDVPAWVIWRNANGNFPNPPHQPK